jgi:triacylglycerol esterase/lipase EstA (alpha/beta hydrolase family)
MRNRSTSIRIAAVFLLAGALVLPGTAAGADPLPAPSGAGQTTKAIPTKLPARQPLGKLPAEVKQAAQPGFVPTPAPSMKAPAAGSGRVGAALAPGTSVFDTEDWPIANYAGSGCIVARGAADLEPVVKTGCSLQYIDQFWRLRGTGDGFYQIRNANTDKCLLIQGGANETPAVVVGCSNYPDQHWRIVEDSTHRYFMIQNRNSGLCLVMRSGNSNARQVPCAQQFVDQWWMRGMPSAPARADGLDDPVILVHGYDQPGNGINANGSYWAGVVRDLRDPNRGPGALSGAIAKTYAYCFYYNDTGCDVRADGDRNRDIRQLGVDLAWYIYNYFSKFNASVDVMAHSMGGLVTNAAITGVQNHDPAFPPYLFVEDAVALSTPWNGSFASTLCALTTNFVQCIQMQPGRLPLESLNENAQATMGTDWTLIGLYDDLAVEETSSVPDNYWHYGHKVVYGGGQWPGLYAHMEQLSINPGTYAYGYCDWYVTSCNMADRSQFYWIDAGGAPITLAKYGIWSQTYW